MLLQVLYELAAAGRIRRRNGVDEREMVLQTIKIFFHLFIFCLDVCLIGYAYSEGLEDAAETLTSFAVCATRFFAELTLAIWAGFLPEARTSEAMFALCIVTGLVFFTRAVFLLARGFWSLSFVIGVNSLIWFSRGRQAAPGHAHQM